MAVVARAAVTMVDVKRRMTSVVNVHGEKELWKEESVW